MERLVLWHRAVPPARQEVDDPEAVAAWVGSVAERLDGGGGTIIAAAGGAVAATFDTVDVGQAVGLALALLRDAEALDRPVGGMKITFGAAMGDVGLATVGDRQAYVGSCIDRAQLLANRARTGELVLDSPAREVARRAFLFGRSVGTGAAALRGTTVDRAHPHREECRSSLPFLRSAPVANATKSALSEAAALAVSEGASCVVLRGPDGAGARGWLRDLENELSPPLVLRIAGVPGGLEPLGSLRLALRRRWLGPKDIEDELGEGHPIARVVVGEALPKREAVAALRKLVDHFTADGERVWLALDPVATIDAATLEIVGALLGLGGPVFVVARLPVDARIPSVLAAGPTPLEVVLPALRTADAREIAEVVLGEEVGGEVARRVAVLGGETPLGVIEAARALVAAGDLIHESTRFRWRAGPRGGVHAIPMATLFTERLDSLDEAETRMLETVCVAPEGPPADLVAAVADLDGLAPEAREEAIEALLSGSLVTRGATLAASSGALRAHIIHHMPPARVAELRRFVAQAIARSPNHSGQFCRAMLGYYLAEGGHPAEGAQALLEAGVSAIDAGYARSAVRLAAAAVQFHPTADTRAVATRITRAANASAGRRPSAPPTDPSQAPPRISLYDTMSDDQPDEMPVDTSKQAIRALLDGDYETVERCIEMSIAEGHDLAAADRLRAMAHLARGDTQAATKALSRARSRAGDDHRQLARASVTLSWILLHEGNALEAVRAGLGALATSRRLKDPRGEAAALHTLSACYRSLGRFAQAAALDDASPG